MRIRFLLLLVFVLMFVAFAIVQWNDPDPAIWIPIYLVAAVLCYMAYKRRLAQWIYGAAFLAYAIGAVVMWPTVYQGITFSMDRSPAIEEARESLGLSICALAMAYCLILGWGYRKGRS
ncbi:transmembrane 220 family protein [Sabulibacter ruber]|uniref:transmembrane 220 family protein n=1 Tax=Sabulibacter ruber TaxID=2811901 RepID=UPI001A97BB54|nr:transmembrane 220 family protein [Sabulibacter ruber]